MYLSLEKDAEYIVQANLDYTGKWQEYMDLLHQF